MSAIDAYKRAQERFERGEFVLSEEDKEFNRLSDEYFKRFGEGFGILIHSPEAKMPTSWHNERMREVLRTGVPIPERKVPPGIVI